MSTKEAHTNDPSRCDRAGLIPDFAFDELAASDRRSVEQHLLQCSACAAELDRLRLTTAALHVLPEQEVPRRIAFVSDQTPEPGWFAGFWNSASRLGFASACILTAGLVYFAAHRPVEIPAVPQTVEVSKPSVPDATDVIAKAVSEAVEKTRTEDLRLTKVALDAVESKYAQKQQNLLVMMQENLEFQRKKLNTYAVLSSEERMGAGQ